MKQIMFIALLQFFVSLTVFAQNKFIKNQKVEVEWKGKWYKATVLEAKDQAYKVHYDGFASSWDEMVTASRIRPLQNGTVSPVAAKGNSTPRYGKYNCTASKYSGGSYEYIAKGSFVLNKNGSYAYNGFSKPSTGTFTVDANGIVSFKGGYLDKGRATPMEGQENRYYLVFPTIPDGRWTCKWIE